MTDIPIPVGSTLEITVPDSASIVPGDITCAIAGYTDTDGLTCTGLEDKKTLQFPILY